jgi:signal recognition particle subunit SRP54
MMSRLGPLSSLVKFLPGASNTVSDTALEKGELEMRRFRAIINSMTPKERITPALINDSRTKRIATGAGVLKTDVALLIERFQQVQQYAKLFKKSGLLKGLFK